MDYQIPLLLVVVAITLFYSFGGKRKIEKKRCVQATSVVLALFSGFRSWWMGDLIKYYTLYRNCNGTDWREYVFEDISNVGIRLFFKGAGMLGISYDVCIFLIAVLVAVSLGVLVYRYSPSPYWSYLMYISIGLYLFTYSGLKQTIAMSFLIFAACCYFEKKHAKMVIWTLIAALFHAPALIFLLVFLMPTRWVDIRYIAVVASITAICFLFKGQLVTFLGELYYEAGETFETINEVGGRFVMMLIIMGLALIMRPIKTWDKIYFKTFNLMVLASLCQIFSVYDNNFSRLADYFYQFIALFVPLMLEPGNQQAKLYPEHSDEIRRWDRRVYYIAAIGITAFAFWYYSSYVEASYALLKDYKFFWEIDAHSLYGA